LKTHLAGGHGETFVGKTRHHLRRVMIDDVIVAHPVVLLSVTMQKKSRKQHGEGFINHHHKAKVHSKSSPPLSLA
jgi:hypothetical protein